MRKSVQSSTVVAEGDGKENPIAYAVLQLKSEAITRLNTRHRHRERAARSHRSPKMLNASKGSNLVGWRFGTRRPCLMKPWERFYAVPRCLVPCGHHQMEYSTPIISR